MPAVGCEKRGVRVSELAAQQHLVFFYSFRFLYPHTSTHMYTEENHTSDHECHAGAGVRAMYI